MWSLKVFTLSRYLLFRNFAVSTASVAVFPYLAFSHQSASFRPGFSLLNYCFLLSKNNTSVCFWYADLETSKEIFQYALKAISPQVRFQVFCLLKWPHRVTHRCFCCRWKWPAMPWPLVKCSFAAFLLGNVRKFQKDQCVSCCFSNSGAQADWQTCSPVQQLPHGAPPSFVWHHVQAVWSHQRRDEEDQLLCSGSLSQTGRAFFKSSILYSWFLLPLNAHPLLCVFLPGCSFGGW